MREKGGEEREVTLVQGQTVRLREVPVRRAAVYAPGGRNPYPSTVVMGAVTARAAGVAEVVVICPPGADGDAHAVVLAACSSDHAVPATDGASDRSTSWSIMPGSSMSPRSTSFRSPNGT